MRRVLSISSLVMILALILTLTAVAASPTFPETIPLPTGFEPEGIAVGRGTNFYAGSLVSGAIFAGDLRTGEGQVLVPPQTGRVAAGLAVDVRSNYLFVAGNGTGQAYVYDAKTGANVEAYQLTDPGTFVNDVTVTRDAAYFTDSFRPYLYRLPLGPGGRVPDASQAAIEEIPLTGDFVFVPGGFNANGIDATPNGKWLIIVNSASGDLYRVAPETGETTLIDLGGGAVPNGDGILLDGGHTLYVMQNFLEQIAVVELDPSLMAGTITGYITDDDFEVPTTLAEFGPYLYAVNARFDVSPPNAPDPTLDFDIVQVEKH